VDLQEKPARFDHDGFKLGDLDALAHGRARRLLNEFGDALARLNDLLGVRFGAGDDAQRAHADGRGGGVFEQRAALQVGSVLLLFLIHCMPLCE
jgi:hypothetical protein